MNVTVRFAGLDELDTLMQWRMEVLKEVFGVCPGKELENENRRYYEKALSEGGHVACFACAEGKTIGCGGMCLYREMPSPDNPTGQCAYLMNIYVRPPFRGHGAGEAIVRFLLNEARRRGVSKIYLEATPRAKPLYRKIGFRDMAGFLIFAGAEA